MKILKRTIIALVIFTFVLVNISPSINTHAASVKLNKKYMELQVGDSSKLKIIGTKNSVTWKSNNKKIATVSSNGTVTAVKDGTTKIVATVNKKTYTCVVSIEKAVVNEPDITAKTIILDTGMTMVSVLYITNDGELPLTIDVNGYVNNVGYENLNSYVDLFDINDDDFPFIESIDVESGDSATVTYRSAEYYEFWTDDDTRLQFNFIYDGIEFIGTTNADGDFSYDQGKIEE